MRRLLVAFGGAAAGLLLTAVPALACGGLVAPDGDVRLNKAETLVAWHNGIEHYVTAFSYTGSTADVGWIVPLPAVPDSIQAAGRWTLQRLELEFQPPELKGAGIPAGTFEAAGSIVVEQVQVEALDVTVLKGSGSQVVDWCIHNGFLLPAETKDHLLVYAHATSVFMAAKYNTSVAQLRGLQSGDGVPLLITMRTPRLWVPLEVLANDDSIVNADLFLLTDSPLRTEQQQTPFGFLLSGDNVDGASGFAFVRSETLSARLRHDLAGDRNMSWMPASGWLTYLTLNAPGATVTYDLGVGSDDVIRLASFGTSPWSIGRDVYGVADLGPSALPAGLGILAAAAVLLTLGLSRLQQLAMSTGASAPSGVNPSTRERK